MLTPKRSLVLDLKTAFGSVGPLLPLIGVLVGFIPGCGPQGFGRNSLRKRRCSLRRFNWQCNL